MCAQEKRKQTLGEFKGVSATFHHEVVSGFEKKNAVCLAQAKESTQ